MLGQHQVPAARQALCNSQGDQQPNQAGTTTGSTAAAPSPSLHPQDASHFVSPQSYFKPVFQSYRKHESFHSSFKPVSSWYTATLLTTWATQLKCYHGTATTESCLLPTRPHLITSTKHLCAGFADSRVQLTDLPVLHKKIRSSSTPSLSVTPV